MPEKSKFHDIRTSSRRHLSEHRWFWILFGVLCIPIVVWIVSWVRSAWFPAGDEALIAIRMYDAWTGNGPLVGMRSTSTETDPNIMAFHPGPMQFYLFGLPFMVFGWSNAGLLVAGGLWLAFFVGVALWSGYKAAGLPGLAVIASGIVLLYGLFDSTLVLPWNPWLPVIGLFATLTIAWRMFMGDQGLWPLFMFCVSYIAQAHLGVAPLAFTLGLALLVQAIIRWRLDPRHTVRSKEVKWTLLVWFVCWLGPLINLLTYAPSNVGQILALTRDDSGQPDVVQQSLVHVSHLLFPWYRLSRQYGEITVAGAVIFAAAIAILLLSLYEFRKGEREVGGLEYAARSGIILGLFITVVTVWAGTSTGGGLRILFLDYLQAGPLFLALMTVFWAVIRLREEYPIVWIRNGQVIGIVAIVAAVAVAVFGPTSQQREFVGVAYEQDLDHAATVLNKLQPILLDERFDGMPLYLHSGGFRSWGGISPAVSFDLVRHGKEVFFTSPWSIRADDEFRRPHSLTRPYVHVVIEDLNTNSEATEVFEPFQTDKAILEEFTVPVTGAPGEFFRVRVFLDKP